MSAALETLLEAARYIELMERQRGDRVHTVHLHETTINSDNLNHSSIISSHNSPYQPPNISSINNNNNNNNNISNNFSVNNNNNNSTIRYNNVANNQLFISSPQVSPITTSNLNNILQNSHHQVIHQQQQRNEFNNMVNASNTIRIEARRVNNNEETFGPSGVTTNGHSSVAPPLVVISPQQQIHNNSSNHNNSLSPPSTSSSSFELSRSRSSSVSSTTLPPSTTPTITHLSGGGHTITTNGLYQHQLQNGGDDSNQSSLNLSNVSSGYISGSSANSSIGSTNLNISGNLSNLTNGILTISEQQTLQAQSIAAGGRRRTTSTNSNGTQRSPCILRAGTREVHNKLEKNRRAHLKECFEQLKKQLPSMPEEKKTSNLSILGAAIRFVGSLKRKERELEHEMERLAKEKIAAQQKILLLKRELSAQWDHIDFSTIIPETDVGTIREREPVNELSLGRGCPRYSSTSSLSSVATSSSPCTTIGVAISSPMPITTNSTSMPSVISTTQFNNINNNNINNSNINNNQNKLNSSHPIMNHNINVSSPNNILINNHNNNNNSVSLPLSFSQQQQQHTLKTTSQQQQHHHHQMIEMSMQSLNKKTNQMAINLTSDGTSALIVASNASNMPLNLNNNLSNNNNNINVNLSNNKASSPSPSTIITTSSSATTNNLLTQSLQIISTNTHNLNSNNIVHNINSKDMLTHKNGIRVAEIGRQEPVPSLMLNKELNKVELLTAKLADSSEPPTKVIKLINGSTIALASVDKDNKIIGSSPTTLTLQQVVGGGGLVVSPIPLLTSSQGLRVIGQSQNGIATIELSTPLGQQQARNALQNHVAACGANGPQLHKLLVSGTTSVVTQSSTTVTPELARLPGGAELNILPANSNGTLYRSQKLAFVNNGITIKGDGNSSSRVQLVTPIQSNNSSLSGLTPIVVNHQQGQGTTNIAQLIAASTSQLSGKVMTPITVSPYVVKPMMVAVASSTATSSLTTTSMSKQQTILAAPSNNNTSINGNCI